MWLLAQAGSWPATGGLHFAVAYDIFVWANILKKSSVQVNLIFRAFSDSTRLRILCLLTGGEMCVGDLVKVLQVPQPTASRHLSYLRRAGLVEARKNALWVHYRLANAKSAFHRNLLKCLGNCFHDVPEIAGDAKRAGLVKRTGGCCPV
jgi:ArsR family transcriptional regulator